MIATCVRVLLGCYRRGEAEDAEIYTKAVVAVLGRYPESIVRAVTDPRGGLPAKVKFLPTIFEITEACEAKMRPLLEVQRRAARLAQQAADRPAPISPAEASRRKEIISVWRAGQRALAPAPSAPERIAS